MNPIPAPSLDDETHASLQTPAEVRASLPLSLSERLLVSRTRQEICNIFTGMDRRKIVIMGPCSIHDEGSTLEYASRLAELREDVQDSLLIVMRTYFEKPRTGPGWKGFINDPRLDGSNAIGEGLIRARNILRSVLALGVPCATEVLDPHSVPYLADAISWSAIGARTSESQLHREVASGLESPVGFKNTIDGRIDVAIEAVKSAARAHRYLGVGQSGRLEVASTKGNPAPHIILRGGSSGPNYDRSSIELTAELARSAALSPAIIVDCSHANSRKVPSKQPAILAELVQCMTENVPGLCGVMLESHIHEGQQKLEDPSALRYGVSITDGCIGWEESEACIREMHARVKGSL
jgi:3-deoxy-7-phosphoheptulonate synthase